MRLHPVRFLTLSILLAAGAHAQQGATKGEWRFYGGDAGSTKYSPLDQINASNVKQLEIAWRWKAENFGPRPDYNWEATPLMIGGVLYFTAGSRHAAVAVDGATGETSGIVELTEGLDRDVVKPGQIGSSSPAIVIRDVVVVGAALQAGSAPASKTNVPGRTGKKLWTFRTIPHPGEMGNETWEKDSWQYTGNTGAL